MDHRLIKSVGLLVCSYKRSWDFSSFCNIYHLEYYDTAYALPIVCVVWWVCIEPFLVSPYHPSRGYWIFLGALILMLMSNYWLFQMVDDWPGHAMNWQAGCGGLGGWWLSHAVLTDPTMLARSDVYSHYQEQVHYAAVRFPRWPYYPLQRLSREMPDLCVCQICRAMKANRCFGSGGPRQLRIGSVLISMLSKMNCHIWPPLRSPYNWAGQKASEVHYHWIF